MREKVLYKQITAVPSQCSNKQTHKIMNYDTLTLSALEYYLKSAKATLSNKKWASVVSRSEHIEISAMAYNLQDEIDERKRKNALADRIEMQEVRAMKIQMGVASYGY